MLRHCYILFLFLATLSLSAATSANATCKVSPNDVTWPSTEEWTALNRSIEGTLIKTAPAASSCYPGNPFGSNENCTEVTRHWPYAAYHAMWPESIDYSIYANHSCLPPGVDGYTEGKGCSTGGLPQYIVNASTERQIATAMKWASERGIRITVKGTGHDLNGRSTGAYALSIWTHNFNHVEHRPEWQLPDGSGTANVVICGSGNTWGSAYTAVHKVGRVVVGGVDPTVGLGGLIQNGGHGHLSSHYGLASDSVYQVSVVTVSGHRLVANNVQNQDLFWAIRGGGGGQYGVVTEFVLKTHPVPQNVVTGSLVFRPSQNSAAGERASWDALAEAASLIPDVMDSGLTGIVMAATKKSAVSMMGLNETIPGVAATVGLTGFNMTSEHMDATLDWLESRLDGGGGGNKSHLAITRQPPSTQSYWSYNKPNPLSSQAAGSGGLFTSRLLGRNEFTNIAKDSLVTYLQQILVSQDPTAGSMLLFGLHGGPGPSSTPENMRGSVLPAWRSAYAHVMAYGASVNGIGDPSKALAAAARWHETVTEPVWRNWAPGTGAYMNEGNAFSSTWKHDFYGENYDRLLEIKRKYDPTESLFVWSGVRSDMWEYELNTGLLCRVTPA
ncbi:Berberine and berberine like protein [Aspergillus sp. HF37]|nr:Berberine and berberine like protein [Aspergillus sp. HF37]